MHNISHNNSHLQCVTCTSFGNILARLLETHASSEKCFMHLWGQVRPKVSISGTNLQHHTTNGKSANHAGFGYFAQKMTGSLVENSQPAYHMWHTSLQLPSACGRSRKVPCRASTALIPSGLPTLICWLDSVWAVKSSSCCASPRGFVIAILQWWSNLAGVYGLVEQLVCSWMLACAILLLKDACTGKSQENLRHNWRKHQSTVAAPQGSPISDC